MIEFGSDFHTIRDYPARFQLQDLLGSECQFFGSGRGALIALLQQASWQRIWVPDYYCYEVITAVQKVLPITIMFYQENPLTNLDYRDLAKLPLAPGDVLLRHNFFGLKSWQDCRDFPVPVIEDHTHDLLGTWPRKSRAAYCFCSLRKTLPLPVGGLLWSPKNLPIPAAVSTPKEQIRIQGIAEKRWQAMDLKSDYLFTGRPVKDEFRTLFLASEEILADQGALPLDQQSHHFLQNFDLPRWGQVKEGHWQLLARELGHHCSILKPQDGAQSFSAILLLASNEEREQLRHYLISRAVYPAVLWALPDDASIEARHFSGRMLSVHCDGRYNDRDIKQLAAIIKEGLHDLPHSHP